MYSIRRNRDHLLVEFTANFDYGTMKAVLHHVTMLKEYPETDDIWLIGQHRSSIRLQEVGDLVQDFSCRCPYDMTRKKTAIVVDQGLTFAVLSLWVSAVQQKVPFEIRLFETLDEAHAWIGSEKSAVA